MEISGSRILVIGGAGFIGSHLVDQLLELDVKEVLIYDNFTRGRVSNLASALKDPRVRIAEGGGDKMQLDTLKSAMEGVDGVFDFAALWLLHCQKFPRSAFKVNVEGSFNVIETAISSGVKKIVHSSSASVYGDAVQEPMNEDHPFNFANFYGATKAATEHIYTGAFNLYKNSPMHFDFVGLRYMNVYGSRQDYLGTYIAVLMRMLDSIKRGLPIQIYGDGSQSYDFVHVKDCARANLLAMKSSATNVFLNVGTEVKTSLNQIGLDLLEITGSSVGIEYLPEGTSFVTNRVGGKNLAMETIGFNFEIDIIEGLKELVEWRENHQLDVQERILSSGL
jgi:UDP-glucose 4-epimerase